MSINKVITLLVWLAGLVAFIFPSETTVGGILRAVFIFLVVAHTIEIAIFWKVLKNAPGSFGNHLLQTFLFGIFHVAPLKKAQQAA